MKNLVFVLLGVLLIVVGCEKAAPKASEASAASEPLPANLIATTQPAGAIDVVAARKSAKDGDSIVVKGQIGGQEEPLSSNRAVMTITDLSLPTCEKTPMDTCPTPWDSCCELTETITANSATVQVAGVDGKPIKSGLNGVSGIAPGKRVVVAGTAKVLAGSDSLVVEAKQIYVIP